MTILSCNFEEEKKRKTKCSYKNNPVHRSITTIYISLYTFHKNILGEQSDSGTKTQPKKGGVELYIPRNSDMTKCAIYWKQTCGIYKFLKC